MKRPYWFRVVALITTSVAGGCLLDVTSCAKTVASNVNPCGTVLSTTYCNPFQWQEMFVEPQDWERDPTCTIPYMCGPWPPVTQPSGTSSTSTSTSTTSNTNTSNTGSTSSSLFGF